MVISYGPSMLQLLTLIYQMHHIDTSITKPLSTPVYSGSLINRSFGCSTDTKTTIQPFPGGLARTGRWSRRTVGFEAETEIASISAFLSERNSAFKSLRLS